MKIDKMTDEELVELITEILDSPRAFKLLVKIPTARLKPHGFIDLLDTKEFPKKK